jgi:hypothetical protein
VLAGKTSLRCYTSNNEHQLIANYTSFKINIINRGFATPVFLFSTGQQNEVCNHIPNY